MTPAPPLFFAFDPAVPDARTCLDQAYEAFSSYRVARGFCRQCFTPDEEARICGHGAVRAAHYDSFSPIYFEHPNCSGGIATFKHYLPRALDCAAFDMRLYPTLPGQIARLGLLCWPRDEQQGLRNLFIRAAVDWFATGQPGGLGAQGPEDIKGAWLPAIETAEILLSALTLLRVDPLSLARHMLSTDTVWTTLGLAAAVDRPYVLEDIGYLVLGDAGDEGAMRSAFAALDRNARAGFHRVISYEALMGRWEATLARGDEKLGAYLLAAMDRSEPPQLAEFTDDAVIVAGVVGD